MAGGGVCCGAWAPLATGGWADWFAFEVSGCGAVCAEQKAAEINPNKIKRQTGAKWVGFKLILAPNSVD